MPARDVVNLLKNENHLGKDLNLAFIGEHILSKTYLFYNSL